MTTSWLAYFDDLEQRSPLYRMQAAHFVQRLAGAVDLSPSQRVLDFGCGLGHVTALLAHRVAEVWWWDPAPGMRASTARTTHGLANVHPCELCQPPGEPDRERLPPFDLIVVNSVAQYMTPGELDAWLQRWRLMLTSGGEVVLSDLIPARRHSWSDVVDLLRFSAAHGSRIRGAADALGGLRRYARTARSMPLQAVDEADLFRRAGTAGLHVTHLPENLTHFRARWSALLQARAQPTS